MADGIKMGTSFLNSIDSRGREQFEAAINVLQGGYFSGSGPDLVDVLYIESVSEK